MSDNSQSNRSTYPPVAVSQHPGGRDQLGRDERFGPDRRTVENAGHDGDAGWNHTPNPFSHLLAASEPKATDRFVRAAKTLVIMLALTALLLAGVFYGKQFLLARLVAGFDDLDDASQQSRLIQIASFGSDAIEPLVGKLASADDVVSESALTLLQQLQNDWITLPPDAAQATHDRMIRAIATVFVAPHETGSLGQQSPRPVSPGGVARASELLRQSIVEFATTPAQSSELLVAANRVLTQLNGSSATTPTLVKSPIKTGAPRKLHAVAKIVQLSRPVQQSGWTDWPPPASTQSATIVGRGTRQAKYDDEMTSAHVMSAKANLRALPPGVTAPLRPITARDRGPAVHSVILHPVIATSRPIGLVSQVSACADDVALNALSDVALLRQLASPDRRVRLQAAAALETTKDADVLAKLREQLGRETDPHVAARIRRILHLF